MGSSVGNFERHEAAAFLQSFATKLSPCDMLLIGVDGCVDEAKVYKAYNDTKGKTEEFYRNGLKHANNILEFELFKQSDWTVIGEFDALYKRHSAFISPKKDIVCHEFSFNVGERIRIENAFKYTTTQMQELWSQSRLALRASYADESGYCELHSNVSPISVLIMEYRVLRNNSCNGYVTYGAVHGVVVPADGLNDMHQAL